ncbi:tetratricopeptide repeat protein [Aquimarina rubra]|uniref:Tetratricopeptide repeat protein n=1 Tax=Aquimarina rubra TaxID=1920033 RepID=A0ABW5L9D3_9FLAO
MKKILLILPLIIITFTSCDFKSSSDYNAEAENLENEGRYKEAITLLDKALEKDPENIYALLNRALDKSILKDYEGSIKDYSKVIELDERNTLAYINRGNVKNVINDFKGAIEDCEKAIKTKGTESIYMDLSENSFVDLGFEFDVKMEKIRFERGIARYNIDSLKLAFEDFDFCVEKNYELALSYYWRGIIFLSYGMNNEGCEDLFESQKLGNENAKELIEKNCKQTKN